MGSVGGLGAFNVSIAGSLEIIEATGASEGWCQPLFRQTHSPTMYAIIVIP